MSSTTENPPRATLVASLTEAPDASGDEVRALSGQADCLEVRADLVGEVGVGVVAGAVRGRAPLHAAERGGRRSRAGRAGAPRGAALGGPRLRPGRHRGGPRPGFRTVLDAVANRGDASCPGMAGRAAEREGPAGPPEAGFRPSRRGSASWSSAAENSGEELAPLELLLESDREDVAAFSMGAVGAWTRLAAPRFGAPWIYGAAGPLAAAPGQPSIERLRADYDLPRLHRAKTAVRRRRPPGGAQPVAQAPQRRLPRPGRGGALRRLRRAVVRGASGARSREATSSTARACPWAA